MNAPFCVRGLRVWVVVNPTSGFGRGEALMRRLRRELQAQFGEDVAQLLKSGELMSCAASDVNGDAANLHNDVTGAQYDGTTEHPLLSSFASKQQPDVDGETVSRYIASGGMRIRIIPTEKTTNGQDIAEHLTKMFVEARLRRFTQKTFASATETRDTAAEGESLRCETNPLHIFVAIGGDGSLGDVVNGMCRGTLQAFRESVPTLVKHSVPTAGEDDGALAQYWRMLEDKSILRHFLPPLIYIPAGTGSDFARLKLCCRHERDLVAVLRGICKQLLSTSTLYSAQPKNGELGSSNLCSNGWSKTSCDSTNGTTANQEPALFGFEVHDVDVSRVFFPRSGRQYFFINECSVGMSCDVVNKCEEYKQNRLLLMAGGTIMFAAASLVSVIQMKPKPFRLLPLPDVPELPSNDLITRRIGGGFLHSHMTTDDTAFFGVQKDLQWVEESARRKALPATDPLCSRANYYVYEKRKEDTALPGDKPTTSSDGDRGSGETVVNPFYSDYPCQDAATSNEICAAVNAADASSRWICFRSLTLVFGNGRWFGGGLKVTPHASPTDGRLSVTNWVAGFARFVLNAPSVYSGKHTNWPTTAIWSTTRSVVDVDTRPSQTASANHKAPSRGEELMVSCEVDGELREQLPAIVEISGVLTMIVPQLQAASKNKKRVIERCCLM